MRNRVEEHNINEESVFAQHMERYNFEYIIFLGNEEKLKEIKKIF